MLRDPSARLGIVLWAMVSSAAIAGCNNDLGHCDAEAANELVYNRTGQIATKGQALTQDSCGNGGFCHAKAAKGGDRYGAPAGLDYDMLPSPTGVHKVRATADDSWDLVRDGLMPPRRVGDKVVSDGDWIASPDRDPSAPRLPKLSSTRGLAIYRNWLACGAPVVTSNGQTDGGFTSEGPVPTWSEIHGQILTPYCATAGCHNTQTPAGGLALEDRCSSARALKAAGSCGKYGIVPSSPEGSFLYEKISETRPSCGGIMPPNGSLPQSMIEAVRAYIAAGAEVDACP